MYTYNKFKFTLTRNESEEETLEDQDAFCWYFFDSPGIGYDVFSQDRSRVRYPCFEQNTQDISAR